MSRHGSSHGQNSKNIQRNEELESLVSHSRCLATIAHGHNAFGGHSLTKLDTPFTNNFDANTCPALLPSWRCQLQFPTQGVHTRLLYARLSRVHARTAPNASSNTRQTTASVAAPYKATQADPSPQGTEDIPCPTAGASPPPVITRESDLRHHPGARSAGTEPSALEGVGWVNEAPPTVLSKSLHALKTYPIADAE